MIKIGQPAPYFKGEAYVNGEFKNVSLSDYRGKWVIFFFYPLDFTFVCPTELRAFAEQEKEFKTCGAEIISCSIDSKFSHKAWFERDLKEVKYPVLSDITKTISRDYGVLNEEKGIAVHIKCRVAFCEPFTKNRNRVILTSELNALKLIFI